jgi:D-glycero-alpha-D-manno-heptose-7-phosphate kinase
MTQCEIRGHRSSEIVLRSLDLRREDRFADAYALLKAKAAKHSLAWHICRFFLDSSKLDPSRAKNGFVLETDSESPAGAGISGSSALMVATTAALAKHSGRKLSKEQIRHIAQNIETQIIQVPTGCQDYFPALYGGLSALHLREDGVQREALDIPAAEINSRFLLAYTGAPRQSGINNWEVFKSHINGEKTVFRNFAEISGIAVAMRESLLQRNWEEVARLLREEWKLRRANAPGITTPLIEKLVAVATKKGALAAKACGAGGGGCVVFVVEPDAHDKVAAVLQQNGGKMIPFRLATKGLTIQA